MAFEPLRALLAAVLFASAPAWAIDRVAAAGDSIVFEGRISRASADDFLRLLALGSATRLTITSGGGDVEAGLDMAEAILERGLDVEAPIRCQSSCSNYVLAAGRRKILGRPGAASWHGNMAHVLFLHASGRAPLGPNALASALLLGERERAFYARAGVDGFLCWFAKIEPHDVPDFYALSVQDMARFGWLGVEIERPDASPSPDAVLIDVDWDRAPPRQPGLPG